MKKRKPKRRRYRELNESDQSVTHTQHPYHFWLTVMQLRRDRKRIWLRWTHDGWEIL